MKGIWFVLLAVVCVVASAKSALKQKRSDDYFVKRGQSDGQTTENILKHIKGVNEQFLCELRSLGAGYSEIKNILYEDWKDDKLSEEEEKLANEYAEKVNAAAASLDKFVKLDEDIMKDTDVDTNDPSIKGISEHAKRLGCTGEIFTNVESKSGACAGLEVAGYCLYHAVNGIIQIANECNESSERKLKKIKHIVQLVKKEEEKLKQLAKACHPMFDLDQTASTEKRVLRKLEELLLSRKST